MQVLTRDQIISASDLPTLPVPTPEWGKDSGVFVRSLTALERDGWDKRTYQGKTDVELLGYKSRFCVLTICGEDGVRIFGDTDADMLAQKSAAAVERIFNVAAKLNGLLAKTSEDIEKNSEAAPSVESSGT